MNTARVKQTERKKKFLMIFVCQLSINIVCAHFLAYRPRFDDDFFFTLLLLSHSTMSAQACVRFNILLSYRIVNKIRVIIRFHFHPSLHWTVEQQWHITKTKVEFDIITHRRTDDEIYEEKYVKALPVTTKCVDVDDVVAGDGGDDDTATMSFYATTCLNSIFHSCKVINSLRWIIFIPIFKCLLF